MSGHSKWHQIKRKKEATDAKRGAQFTKLATQIKAAIRSNPNPSTNTALAEAINRAKQANMPQENIDRILLKATDTATESATYEAFGPNGVALIIIARTDNPRRTIAELRTTLKKHHGTISEPGSVMWKFDTAAGQLKPKYPQTVTEETQQKITTLLIELREHPDVEQIHTDAVQ